MATPLDSGVFRDLVERAIEIQPPNRQEALAVLRVSDSETLSLVAEVARVRSFESNSAWTTRLPESPASGNYATNCDATAGLRLYRMPSSRIRRATR